MRENSPEDGERQFWRMKWELVFQSFWFDPLGCFPQALYWQIKRSLQFDSKIDWNDDVYLIGSVTFKIWLVHNQTPRVRAWFIFLHLKDNHTPLTTDMCGKERLLRSEDILIWNKDTLENECMHTFYLFYPHEKTCPHERKKEYIETRIPVKMQSPIDWWQLSGAWERVAINLRSIKSARRCRHHHLLLNILSIELCGDRRIAPQSSIDKKQNGGVEIPV